MSKKKKGRELLRSRPSQPSVIPIFNSESVVFHTEDSLTRKKNGAERPPVAGRILIPLVGELWSAWPDSHRHPMVGSHQSYYWTTRARRAFFIYSLSKAADIKKRILNRKAKMAPTIHRSHTQTLGEYDI